MSFSSFPFSFPFECEQSYTHKCTPSQLKYGFDVVVRCCDRKMKAYDSFANNVNNDVMHTLIPSTPLEDTQSSSFEIVGLLHEWLWVVAQLHESTVNTKAAQKALDHVEERLDLKNSNHRVSYHE